MADMVSTLTTKLMEARKPDLARFRRRRSQHRMPSGRMMSGARHPRGRVSKTVQRRQRGRISAKISKLAAEGEPPKKRVATALHMAEAGRLGPRGGYRRA